MLLIFSLHLYLPSGMLVYWLSFYPNVPVALKIYRAWLCLTGISSNAKLQQYTQGETHSAPTHINKPVIASLDLVVYHWPHYYDSTLSLTSMSCPAIMDVKNSPRPPPSCELKKIKQSWLRKFRNFKFIGCSSKWLQRSCPITVPMHLFEITCCLFFPQNRSLKWTTMCTSLEVALVSITGHSETENVPANTSTLMGSLQMEGLQF